ncbi:MAG: hypothetical protein QXG96_02620 [Candidatus Bathyarchaeia archaeon]
MSLSEGLIEELERDPRARKRIAELLVIEPDIGFAMINALITDVATKRDLADLRAELRAEINCTRSELKDEIGQLRSETKGEMSEFRSEIARLRAEALSNFGWIIGTILAIWGATAIPILLRLIGAI